MFFGGCSGFSPLMVVARFFNGEFAGMIFSGSGFLFAFFFLLPASSNWGTTSAISSGFKLSSLGALSEPADEVFSPSV